MKLFRISMVAALVVSVSACGPVYQTKYSYIRPKTRRGNMCLNRCINIRNNCQAMNQSCRADADHNAGPEYRRYVRRQRRRNKDVFMSRSDFADYSGCNTDCTGSYNQCYENCGGQVIATQVCVAFCDKK